MLKVFLTTGAAMALVIGCSTTPQKEDILSAAGFKMVPADTPERQAHLKSLPPDKITTVQRSGKLYYTFPDPKKNVLYVGGEQQYQQYRKLRLEKQMADEQLTAASMNEDAWNSWGPWGFGW